MTASSDVESLDDESTGVESAGVESAGVESCAHAGRERIRMQITTKNKRIRITTTIERWYPSQRNGKSTIGEGGKAIKRRGLENKRKRLIRQRVKKRKGDSYLLFLIYSLLV